MFIQKVQCDVCGAIKGEANRWLVGSLYSNRNGVTFYGLADWPSQTNCDAVENLDHFCSEACAYKQLAKSIRKDEVAHV